MRENRKQLIQLAIILISFAFLVKLFFIQVIDSKYKEDAMNNAVHKVIVYPYRGVIFDRNNKMLVANTPVFDIMMVPRKVNIGDTAQFLQNFNLSKEDYIKTFLAAKKYSQVKPSVFLPTLGNEDFARIQDKLVNYPGFYVQARSVRNYPYKCLANALGYIGEVSQEKIELLGVNNYRAGDYVGISGIEEKYEPELRGQRGVKYVMVNVKGVEKGSFLEGKFDTLSVAGKDLKATIDIELQQYAELLMQGQIGSIVAIEPKTGEVLAFVSSPSYDPNLLTGKDFSKNYRKLVLDSLKPLFNRPLMAMYPPGSTFKPINYMIALKLGLLDTNQVFPCQRSLVNCHGRHSSANFHTGVQYSCNPYAYFVFKKLMYQGFSTNAFVDTRKSFEVWRENALKFGLAKKLGIDLPNEKNGNLPSVKFYNKYFGENRWAFETIYSLGLGQGEILETPIQLANLACIFANRGYYYTPHLIKSIGEKRMIRKEYVEKHELNINKIYFNSMVEAMEDVVSAGTATMARSTVMSICGKTGTAENPHGKDHSLFFGFAPKDNPTIAIAVVMENAGWGATAAAPLASLVIEKYLRKEIKRSYLEDYIRKGVFFE